MKEKDNQQPSLANDVRVAKKVQRLTSEESTNKLDTNIPHLNKLKCSECKEIKDKEDFYISTKYINRGREYRCINCSKKRTIFYHYENKESILKKWKNKRDSYTEQDKINIANKNKIWNITNVKKQLLYRAITRSKKMNVECNLTLEDIIIPNLCPLLEIPFQYGTRNNKWFSCSIDRIDNSKGYVKGNIQIITYLANTMKSQATIKELKTFAKNILLLFKDDDIV